ncbi:hypothetical protein AURDEDRAFT_181840 [Auricularia subglabra TFB-10046 SS5]|nr:hypothetical protein AURDEDRAFT_181840 [Auricularia subglabra TFB-10046 SS5]
MPGHVAALLPIIAAAACSAQFVLQKNLSGHSLLDAFDFDSGFDNSSASEFVNWTSLEPSVALFGGVPNTLNLSVDTSLVQFPAKRRTFSITSKESWRLGSLVVLNVTHMPQGCSLAPIFRTHAKPAQPLTGGSVTVFKRRNFQENATSTLSHMLGNCLLNDDRLADRMQGSIIPNSLNCTSSEECAISYPEPPKDRSMAGTWVLSLAEIAIAIWFFPVNATVVPPALWNDTIRAPEELGIPVARFAFDDPSCKLRDMIEPQYLTISMPLCDGYADAPGQFGAPESTCPGRCYDDWVLGDGTGFRDAFMSIASLRIYANTTLTNTTLVVPPSGDPGWTAPAPLVETPRHVLFAVAAGSFAGMLLGIASWFAGSRLPVSVKPPRLRRRRRPAQ